MRSPASTLYHDTCVTVGRSQVYHQFLPLQAKLAAELEGAGLLWAPGTPGRQLEHADLASLAYLDRVSWRRLPSLR